MVAYSGAHDEQMMQRRAAAKAVCRAAAEHLHIAKEILHLASERLTRSSERLRLGRIGVGLTPHLRYPLRLPC